MTNFKPMLAKDLDLSILQYPVYGSPKLDGIRCVILDGRPVTRKLKDIPNRYIRSVLTNDAYNSLDGEIIIGSPTHEECYRRTESAVMSHGGTPKFNFYVFDTIANIDLPFSQRRNQYRAQAEGLPFVRRVAQTYIQNEKELVDYEQMMVARGFEGIMVRRVNGRYKCGRSTAREQLLLKWKRWMDSEAVILWKNELMKNGNELERDERGYAKRSSHKENMIPMDTLGGLRVRDIHQGWEFDIGSGFTQELRDQLWLLNLKGRIVKYKYVPVGMKDVPRWPIFQGFRQEIDL